ncbi:hypothetical protein K438DRAFT_1926751 [Mycena galopus ATCC 62051]|nr:hypothetical protein K438DRAFT_1926751 [Mycena galopus ATCC 62051]
MNLKKHDSMRMKLFVTGLAVLTALKGLQCLMIMWKQTVEPFLDLEATWIVNINVILEGIVAFYVQMFFSRRLWKLSQNKYIVITCLALFAFALISALVANIFIFTTSDMGTRTGWVSTHLGVVLAGDLLLTGSTVFWLLHHGETVLSRGPAATILNSLVRLTLQSAAPPALCALLIFGVAIRLHLHTADNSVPVLMMLNYMAIMVVPQLYAWSAMWTLNSREEISLATVNGPCTVNLGTESASSDLEASRSPHPGGTPNNANSKALDKGEKLQAMVQVTSFTTPSFFSSVVSSQVPGLASAGRRPWVSTVTN